MRIPGVLVAVAAVAAAVMIVAAAAPSITVPLRFDASGVESLQLNGGRLLLRRGGDEALTARVPLSTLPLLMARNTDGRLLEVGGFDDSDPRVLLTIFVPAEQIPARADEVEWTLTTNSLDTVTVAGGTLVTEGYEAERLVLFGVTGHAELEGLDLGVLAGNLQSPSTLRASGRVGTLSVLDTAGGTVDVTDLAVDRVDPSVIIDIIEAQ